ncbi:TetR family transcriptional regulator [Marihabitans asiaticum]|uniref:TetR family transcriptional regulator n=2 Tax=Marihabitans asiaticum TaxID=415218 RepID=A0A560W806_9MICO|nr:TetR family transcriptional regulator [Marihabitans asiaticum]
MVAKRLLTLLAAGMLINVTPRTLPTPSSDSPAVMRLFDAAADAFAAKGFHATTTRDIASRAGLSPAGVYVHFASKEDLLFQLSRDGHVGARDAMAAAAGDADSPTEALRQMIGRFARWHAEELTLARIVQYEFRHLTDEHRHEVLDLRREIDAVVRSVVEAGMTSGEFDVRDSHATTLALLSLVVDVARWYHPGVRRTPDEIEETYGALALRLVAAR